LSWWRRWRDWIGYATAGWSLAYAALGLYWTLGGAGFPFGIASDPGAARSILIGVDVASGAPAVAGLGLLGALVALVMTRVWASRIVVWVLLAFAWIAAAMLLVVIPDARILIAVAYAPLVLLGAPFGWPPADFRDAIPWPVLNQLILVAGGALWAATAMAFADRTRVSFGCDHARADWTTPDAAARWGRWAVAVAVIIPLLYATTRYAWALGIPLGISDEFLHELQTSGLWVAGAGLGTVAVIGALLTLGLTQEWGEVFPNWLPGVGGKRVPPALAIVPATLVAIFVTSAGLSFIWLWLEQGMPLEGWSTIGPELLWPFWGLALGAATLAYYYRRRDRDVNMDGPRSAADPAPPDAGDIRLHQREQLAGGRGVTP
jgi:hypothetical protein